MPLSSKHDSVGSKSKKELDASHNDVEPGSNMDGTGILSFKSPAPSGT